MSRLIKFRYWNGSTGHMVYEPRIRADYEFSLTEYMNTDRGWQWMQFTGLLDKNGKEIYEGDILLEKRPERDSQTHYGENIPGPTNTYTEPLEPIITKYIHEVVFHDGMFTLKDKLTDGMDAPLRWSNPSLTYDAQTAKDGFSGNWQITYGNNYKWDDTEEGELQYLLETYKLPTEKDLLDYLGIEVIGNIYQNPDLLRA